MGGARAAEIEFDVFAKEVPRFCWLELSPKLAQ